MSGTLKFRAEVIWSGLLLALLVLAVAMVGCGGDRDTGTNVAGRKERVTVTLPPAERKAVESRQPLETSVSEPEPPREVSYAEAEAVFFEKRYEEAVDLFTRYTESKSENPWGYYMLGLSAWKAGENERAETAFERALELDPWHVKSWLNLSRVLLDEGRAEEALAKLEEVLTIDSASSVAHRLQGRAYYQLGRREDAIGAYREAILIDDVDAWSMNNMGLILIEEERFGEALLPLARAVELRDDVAIFQNNLGVALERTGHYRAAEEAYKSAVALDGNHEKAFASLVRVQDLTEDADVEPVDLGVLARSFIDEVEGWRESVALEEQPALEELEPIVVSEAKADTTEQEQER